MDSNKVTVEEKEVYRQMIAVDQTGQNVLMGSLKTLSILLEKHYVRKAIILIDEYDVPLAKANEQGIMDR